MFNNFPSTTGVLRRLICSYAPKLAYDAPPEPVVGWGTPSFYSPTLDAFGLSIWEPLALRFLPSPIQISGYATTHYAATKPPVKKFWLRHWMRRKSSFLLLSFNGSESRRTLSPTFAITPFYLIRV